jgi:hypothetical protein
MAQDLKEEADGDMTLLEPTSSKGWLDLLANSKKQFNDWNLRCDNIDKLYANLARLANSSREREFQLFWANLEVLGPSIYSRPPVPVVTPKFKDRRPLYRTGAEVLERAAIVTIEKQSINDIMVDLRDAMMKTSRGQAWLRLGEKYDHPCVYVDYKSRRDFLHDPARTWREVDWVASCSWLTKLEARKRFKKTSGNAYQSAAYMRMNDKENGYTESDTKLKAPFWEIWSKSNNLVVWVAEGCDSVLDQGDPHLDLEEFFPCPKPCYATLQPGTLIPVPEVLFYKDQLEEINEITGRIAALTEALKVKGFYPSGAGNISDAIEAAIQETRNNATLIGIANWGNLGTGDPKDIVLWWPIEQVAKVIKELIALRKELIEDVYQITGLSDIMRGSTEASETLGAQQLKSQYGSVRVRQKQNEMVRIARDVVRIASEIIAENYDLETIAEMSQMELPARDQIKQQVAQLSTQAMQIEGQIAQASQNPQIMAAAQANPEQAQAILQQANSQLQSVIAEIDKLSKTITIDAVVDFLRDNKMRCFSLDIETDSTIQPDEDAAKKRAAEYLSAMAGVFQQAIPAAERLPQMSNVLSEMIIFANKQFRVGRTMEMAVEEFADQMKTMAAQPKADPMAAQQQAEQAKEQHAMQIEAKAAEADAANKQAEIQAGAQRDAAKAQADAVAEQHGHEIKMMEQRDAAAAKDKAIVMEYEIKTLVASRELDLKQILAYADIGLKYQKEIMSADEAAIKEAERTESEGTAKRTDEQKTGELSNLGRSIVEMGEKIVAAASVKRRAAKQPDGSYVSEVVQ